MNSSLDRPRLKLALTGIATLLSLLPTLLYFWATGAEGLEAISRKKEILYYGFLLFGTFQFLAFALLFILIILIWRPEKPSGKLTGPRLLE